MAAHAHTTLARAGERPRAPKPIAVAGELPTATLIIAGGVFAYGFLPIA